MSPQPNLIARQIERSQKPRPAGKTGRGLGVRSLSRIKMRRRPDYSFRRTELYSTT
jgi:hypothetical protein